MEDLNKLKKERLIQKIEYLRSVNDDCIEELKFFLPHLTKGNSEIAKKARKRLEEMDWCDAHLTPEARKRLNKK